MKIATIIGTRPNFIKCAPLSNEIRKKFEEVIIHTGQHYDYEMNKIFFDELGISKPDYHLEVGSGNHGWQTSEMLIKIEEVLMKIKPNLVLVFGDCNCTLAGALAASKLHIKIGHVESGLRSFDKTMPEEINRILVDHCSDFLFCPTKTAVDNLKKEGINDHVFLTGDVMVDALENNKGIAENSDILEKLELTSKNYFVTTIHRASNTDNKKNMNNIIQALNEIDETVIFPVHPRTKKLLKDYNLDIQLKKHVNVINPLGYIDFLKLLNNAKKILTDSGGIQKEAYILKVPCLTLRNNTEWIETVNDGWNILVGTDNEKIVKIVKEFEPQNIQKNVFGKNASKKILGVIKNI